MYKTCTTPTFGTPYFTCAAAFATGLVHAAVLAVLVQDDRWDTGLGCVTGACTALLLGCLLGIAVQRRRRQVEADAASLDRLEPLRADQRDGA